MQICFPSLCSTFRNIKKNRTVVLLQNYKVAGIVVPGMKSESWDQVITLLSNQQDVVALQALMGALLTQEEREAIGSRLAIMQALLAGDETQREIARRIKVSIAKVTRCSNYLKTLSKAEIAIIQPM